MSSSKITAVLAVYNSMSTIKACLDSLLSQSVNLDIIAVDDGSTDKTATIIGGYKEVTLLKQKHKGPAHARNLGASHARGKILLFVDADMTFDKDYVKELVKPILATPKLKERRVVGTYTSNERVANWDNTWARCWNIEEGWEAKKRFKRNPPKYGTDYRAILKSEFDRVGGFDDIGYTDTWSLFHKLGKRPIRTNALCYHKNPGDLRSVFRQAKWSAKRPYKMGIVGILYALMRTSLPVSILVGTYKGIINLELAFIVFKIVYDIGRFVGILEMVATGKLTK